jgi:DHA1 family multidrug resistance protein-like MFS transporter
MRENWQRNLYVLWFGTFMSGAGFSMIVPFMPLYINELGDFTTKELTFWSGLAFSSTFLAMTLISPLWGKVADLKGRRLMLLRSSLCMAVLTFSMGFVSDVYQLIGLRIALGMLAGFRGNAIALMATSAPKEHGGQVLGTLATGNVAGGLFGPIIGGGVAEFFGYRSAFFFTGGILFLVFLLVLTLVKEDFTPVRVVKGTTQPSFVSRLKNPKIIFGMFLTTMFIQITNNSINPVLSLYVKELMNHVGNISVTSGIIAALPGIATLIAAPLFGKLGDRIGTQKILTGGLLLSIIIYIPMAFAQNVWQLGVLRLLIGVSDAALLPSIQAILMKNSPQEVTGRVFGYNQSFQSGGNVIGPMAGSVISGHFGFPAVFLATSVFALVNYLIVRVTTPSRPSPDQS